jgi:LAS superfamily LD-carboxypeptidase LdcB
MNKPKTVASAASLGLVPAYEKWRGEGARKVLGYEKGNPVDLWVVPVAEGEYLEKAAAEQLLALLEEAKAAGHHLTVTSAFRFHEEQRKLHAAYLAGTGNLAAKPGFSNHQRGLSVDLGGVGGFQTAAYKWLKQNAPRYGFENDAPGEHWHWTYAPGKAA